MIELTKDELASLIFSIKCCAGSAYHTDRVISFSDKHNLICELDELVVYQNSQSTKVHELEVIKQKLREEEIKNLQLEMPSDDICEWILDNFDRKSNNKE